MAYYIGNAFSAGMLAKSLNVRFTFYTLEEARAWVRMCKPRSCVGHADTAFLISDMLGENIEMARISTELHAGDALMVAQYNGPRLPEGSLVLPPGATLRWIVAEVVDDKFAFELEQHEAENLYRRTAW